MENLSAQNIFVMFLSLGIVLGAAHLLGELVQRLRQPAIVGEILAGVLLGPTVLGHLAPTWSAFIFPRQGPNAIALEVVANLAIVMFLLVAGMEVDLSIISRQGRVAPRVGVSSIVIPFLVGFMAAWLLPSALGRHAGADPLVFSLFFATALSISALPVIAKTLMDLDLYRSDLGMVVISAAVFNDLLGWIMFAVVLSLLGAAPSWNHSILLTIVLTLTFTGVMLTAGRWLIHKVLPLLQAYTRWPAGVLGFALTLALLSAAFTEWIGIHAIFGAFLVGVALGDSSHLRERTRATIDHFVSFIFAPVFFAGIGLKIDFLAYFSLPLVLTVLLIACICKIAGGALGARWGGMPARDSWAIGFAMNSRGAMEIILGLLALEAGIIRQRLFVALVMMAVVTSMMSGPAIGFLFRQKRRKRLQDFLSARLFIRELHAVTVVEAICELTAAACTATGLKPVAVERAVCEREETFGTGIGHGLAIPHARIEGLRELVAVVGVSARGIDFNAPDDQPAHVIFLLLSPADDPTVQSESLAEISRIFRQPGMTDRALQVKNFTDFLALVKSASGE